MKNDGTERSGYVLIGLRCPTTNAPEEDLKAAGIC